MRGIALLIDAVAAQSGGSGRNERPVFRGDHACPPVAPFRIVNIGNSDKVCGCWTSSTRSRPKIGRPRDPQL